MTHNKTSITPHEEKEIKISTPSPPPIIINVGSVHATTFRGTPKQNVGFYTRFHGRRWQSIQSGTSCPESKKCNRYFLKCDTFHVAQLLLVSSSAVNEVNHPGIESPLRQLISTNSRVLFFCFTVTQITTMYVREVFVLLNLHAWRGYAMEIDFGVFTWAGRWIERGTSRRTFRWIQCGRYRRCRVRCSRSLYCRFRCCRLCRCGVCRRWVQGVGLPIAGTRCLWPGTRFGVEG